MQVCLALFLYIIPAGCFAPFLAHSPAYTHTHTHTHIHTHTHTHTHTHNHLNPSCPRGRFPVLINVGVLTEGTDIPCVDCIMIERTVASPVLMSQMVGRGLRLFPGKTDCLVLDCFEAFKGMSLVVEPVLEPSFGQCSFAFLSFPFLSFAVVVAFIVTVSLLLFARACSCFSALQMALPNQMQMVKTTTRRRRKKKKTARRRRRKRRCKSRTNT